MKVWLDDEPQKPWRASLYPSPQWVHTRWPDETIKLLETGTVTHLGLDHDLADKDDALREKRKERTGYDVVIWIEDQVKNHGFEPPEIQVHSQNGPGRDRILAAVKQIRKYYKERLEKELDALYEQQSALGLSGSQSIEDECDRLIEKIERLGEF